MEPSKESDSRPVERATLCVTRRFSVEERVYRRGPTETFKRAVVLHPGAVVVLPLLTARSMVFVRQFRHAPEVELLELPAGTLEPGEPPIETARRELIEETGYRAGRIEPLIEFYPSPGILSELMRAFVATDLEWVGARPDPGEDLTLETLEIEEVRKRLVAGAFRDGKTLAVLGIFFARMR